MASEIIRRTTEIPFVGREEFLNNLDAHWENNRIIGIHGLRSVGKTRTLFQFLKRKRERSRTDNVSGDRPGPSDDRLQIVYVDLRTLNTCDAFCSHVCAQLEIELKQPHRNIAHVVAQISRVVHKTLNCSTVFIFDNAEDAIEEKEGQFLLSFCSSIIVKCKNVKIILTSTTKASFAGVGKVHASLELLPFTFKESSDFLKQLTRSLDYGENFDSIATLCEGLPLVILMVASELLRGTAPGQMVEFLTDCRIEALSKESYPSDDRIGDVYSKFIDRLSLVLKERLAILGYIPGSFNVWEAKEMTEVRERYCRTFGTVMKRISSQMDTREYSKAVLEFTVEHPNLEKLLKDVFFSTEETYHFYIEIVSSCSALIEKYMSAQGEKFYTACLKLPTDNGRPYDMAAVYIALGNMHTNSKGEYSSGGKIFEQALTLLEHGPPTTKLAVVCEQFGYNLYMQGRGQESLRVLSKSLETLRLLGHQNTEEFLATMSFLGVTYTFLGRYEEAEKYLTDTLNRRKDIQGENHPSVGDQLNRLGILYEQMGMMEKARYYFKRGLEKKKQTKAAKISIVYSLSNVGRQYGEIGKFDKAELVLNEAMGILETESIKNIGAVGLIHNSFGKVYLRKKDYKNAVKHMLESVRIKEMIMQSDPGPFFINPLILLAKGYIGCENYGAAISRIHQALALKDHILKKLPQNDLIFQCYEALANIYFALGNDKLESDTKIEMEKELFRLIKVHEEKQNEAKVVEFNKKLQSLWKI